MRQAIVAGRLALVAVLVPAVPRSADAQWVEPLRASRVTFAVDGRPSGSVAAESAHSRNVPQFILCIRHPVGRAAGGAVFGGAAGAAAGWLAFTLTLGLLASDSGEEYHRARRRATAAGAAGGAVYGAVAALIRSDECVAPPPDLRFDDTNPGL